MSPRRIGRDKRDNCVLRLAPEGRSALAFRMRIRHGRSFLACIFVMCATQVLATPATNAAPTSLAPRRCAWLSQGRLAYVDRLGLVVCSARSAVRLTQTADVRELLWSADGARLRYVVGSETERHFVFNVRSNRSVQLGDDCGFVAFTWCRQYKGADGSTLVISRPRRLPGGISSAPEVVTLRDGNRVVSIHGALPDEFVPLTFPKARRVLIFHAPEIGADEWFDGMLLSVLDFNHGERLLGIRVHGTRTWATLSPDGSTLIASAGGFREAFQRKTLVRCDLAKARCRPWHHLAGFVELDPVWSPDGTRVAFIRARDVTEAQLTSDIGTMPEPWAEGRRLVLTSAAAEPEPAVFATSVDRVESPAWIGSSQLAFVSRDRLFDVDENGTTHFRLVLAAPARAAYYGDANTSDRYAWHA